MLATHRFALIASLDFGPLARRVRACGALAVLALASAALSASPVPAQGLPLSGCGGLDLVYGTDGSGNSQLYALALQLAAKPLPLGAPVAAKPSTWLHRRRALSALEPSILQPEPLVLLTPMGDALGNGAIHLVDARAGFPPVSTLVSTGNPASYDLVHHPALRQVFVLEDAGAAGSVLRGFSYATPGQLTPLNPPSIQIPGRPAASVTRIGLDEVGRRLMIASSLGIQVVNIAASAPQMVPQNFQATALGAPVTNPARVQIGTQQWWMVATASFDGSSAPVNGGCYVWNTGPVLEQSFGQPVGSSKFWVPALGQNELAVVGNATRADVYVLLREPPPGTLFVKPGALAALRFEASVAPAFALEPLTSFSGEPFGNASVQGTRLAFFSQFGPPFSFLTPDGGSTLNLVYSPLDPLGAGLPLGLLAVPAPYGGRIDPRGCDRPLWSRDGRSVAATTSDVPGVPSNGQPGIELLHVPADVPVSGLQSPHTLVQVAPDSQQNYVLPARFDPRFPSLANALANYSAVGTGFSEGVAAVLLTPKSELGQIEEVGAALSLPIAVPSFPNQLPLAFEDATGPSSLIPALMGARRASFNLYPNLGLLGLTMLVADGNTLILQPAGYNALAKLGLFPKLPPIPFALPAGSTTSSEVYAF
jgi:hypothetical protein